MNESVGIFLLMQYYRVRNDDIDYALKRQSEIDDCLIRNAKNDSLDTIHVLVEEYYDFSFVPEENRSKLKVVNIGKRLTYEFAFEYYNKHLSNHICVLANADIYTNNTLDILQDVQFDNVVFAMNRYEHNDRDDLILSNGIEVNLSERHKCPYLVPYQASNWSQDTWIWKARSINTVDCDFALGTPGCDNHIIYQLLSQNFFVCNPSRFICTMHIDRLSIRREEHGVVKGLVSKVRERRVGDMKTYAFVENLDDIPDKYTANIEIYNFHKNPKHSFIKSAKFTKYIVEITPNLCSVTASTQEYPASDIFFESDSHWQPSFFDVNPYVEFNFKTTQSIVVLDLAGKVTSRNDAEIGYVSLFRMEWIGEKDVRKFSIYKGITVPNGNVIHRIYLKNPIVTESLRIYPLKYEGISAMKVRMFSLPINNVDIYINLP